MNKKAQVTLFVIMALVLIVGVVVYFVFVDISAEEEIPQNFQKVETSFLDCVKDNLFLGTSLLESKGGYIKNPEFVPGSSYMPFSSELDFLGIDVPYWYFVTGNNLEREQIPSVEEMEIQLANFLSDKISYCSFRSYYEEGFEINKGENSVKVSIKDDSIEANVEMPLSISFGNDSVLIEEHNVEINSFLGELYNSALEVYEIQKKDMFLENYSVDVLRLYAPVDGLDLSCSPKIWSASEVSSEIKRALEANIFSLKNEGSEEDYFALNLPVESELRFMTSSKWPSTIEISPSEGDFLIANPVGNQEGLGILGFCYVPHHFVYNLRYPVLVQVFKGDETFQFPVAVLIEGNLPRKRRIGESSFIEFPNACEDKLSQIEVNLFDSDLNPVEGNVSYKCFTSNCNIGETSGGNLVGMFPQCVNGKMVVESEGYKKSSSTFSTVNSKSFSAILDREYSREVSLNLGGQDSNKDAIITFSNDGGSQTLVYPADKKVNLSPGKYNISVYVYDNSTLVFEKTVAKTCVDVPASGLGGLLGFKNKECFDVEQPEQIISNVLSGGGKGEFFFLESEIENSDSIKIYAERLNTPSSLEELQINYVLFEGNDLEVEFI